MIQTALDNGVDLAEVYVDTVGDPNKYQEKLKTHFPQIPSITVAKKADATYPIVGAASICAKVVRDDVIRRWECPEGVEPLPDGAGFGSGYPGDDKTKRFLQKALDPLFGFPRIVRFSWSTASKILEDKALLVEWEDDDDDEENAQETAAAQGLSDISTFFKRSGPVTSSTKRHEFFTQRNLYPVSTL